MLDYKGVIFDMDGTLLDSMYVWEKIDIDFLARRGIEVPEDYMHSISHLGAYETALYTIERFGLNDTPEGLIREWIDMAVAEYANVPLKSGASEYISYLKENGIKIAIATASEPEIVKAALCGRSFAKDIDYIATVNDVKRGKGFPDIYLKCAEKLGLNVEDCIVYEDILTGVKGALSGGFKTVAMYDKHSEKSKREIMDIASGYIYNFMDMIR